MAITLLAVAAFLYVYSRAAELRLSGVGGGAQAALFLVIVGFLIYGGLVYQLARLGYMRRRRVFRHPSPETIDTFLAGTRATLCILIPSYKEDPSIVRQAIVSAVLQDYPRKRVVLLIDDPPNPSSSEDRRALEATRWLPREIQLLLDSARAPFSDALRTVQERARAGDFRAERETAMLASLHERAAAWFQAQALANGGGDHSQALFARMVLRLPAAHHAAAAAELRARLRGGGPYPALDQIMRRYRRLDALFDVEVSGFERKRYANLSHAANKAMNLNSYIGLMGRDLRTAPDEEGQALRDAPAGLAELRIPDADYILTLDADSLLAPGYAARLLHLMENPGNAGVAVAQTPYSAVPGARASVERVAGATTDLQYISHQGFTAHGASYWVGANAVLRKRALEQIASPVRDARSGRVHVHYIRDRTVIEDTESTVDLVGYGWQLFNYPARMSYSATPRDFGALVVQRRRWANGGLLILPKLARALARRRARDTGTLHAFMRIHYLISIAAVNVGLTVLFLVPLAGWYANAWLPVTALPYFVMYARDLRLAGYRRRDVVRVYALNLLLVPVNLAGVLASLHQALTGRSATFMRTPKVSGRTAAPPLYIILTAAGTLVLLASAVWSFISGAQWQGIASMLNGLLLVYAVREFVGWRGGLRDVAAGIPAVRFAAANRALRALPAMLCLATAIGVSVTLVLNGLPSRHGQHVLLGALALWAALLLAGAAAGARRGQPGTVRVGAPAATRREAALSRAGSRG